VIVSWNEPLPSVSCVRTSTKSPLSDCGSVRAIPRMGMATRSTEQTSRIQELKLKSTYLMCMQKGGQDAPTAPRSIVFGYRTTTILPVVSSSPALTVTT
jgi:hypothetical protein